MHIFHIGGSIYIWCLLCLEGTSTLWSGDNYGNMYILQIGTKYKQHKIKQKIHSESIYVLEEGRGGLSGCVLSGGSEGNLGVWSFKEELIFQFTIPGDNYIFSLSFHQHLLIIGDNQGNLELWDITKEKQTQIYKIRPHMSAICVKGIQNVWKTNFIITGSSDGFIKLEAIFF